MCFCIFAEYMMFHMLLFFLLNTGCSTCFWFFAKHGMFHVLLFIQDVPCALVFLLNTGCSMCFCFFMKHRIFHVLLFIRDITVAKEHLIKIQAWSVFSPIHLVLAHTHQFRAWLGWPVQSGVCHPIGNNATRTSWSRPEASPMRNRRWDVLQPNQMCVRP